MINNERGAVSSSGIGFAGLLTVLFVGLKLGGVITWPWLWVLSPLWISIALTIIILIIIAVIFIGVAIFVKK